MVVGVNFGIHMPRVEKYNRQSTVDPAVIDPSVGLPGALAFAGENGIPRGLRPARQPGREGSGSWSSQCRQVMSL